MSASTQTTPVRRLRVADLVPRRLGAREIAIAETEMPGLMAIRDEYEGAKPLRGARISGSLHMTIQTAVLIETLKALGAEVRWASCNIFSTQDHAAAAIAAGGTPVFAYKGESLEEYWSLHASHLRVAGRRRLEHDPRRRRGRDAAPAPRREGGEGPARCWASRRARRSGFSSGRSGSDSRSSRAGTRGSLPASGASPRRRRRVSTGSTRCTRGASCASPRSTSTTRSPSRSSTTSTGVASRSLDGIKRATDVMIAGKVAVVCGYGDVGKGCAQALRALSAQVWVTEIDPICALQAAMEGYRVVTLDWTPATRPTSS